VLVTGVVTLHYPPLLSKNPLLSYQPGDFWKPVQGRDALLDISKVSPLIKKAIPEMVERRRESI
jgi:hypothetical protein